MDQQAVAEDASRPVFGACAFVFLVLLGTVILLGGVVAVQSRCSGESCLGAEMEYGIALMLLNLAGALCAVLSLVRGERQTPAAQSGIIGKFLLAAFWLLGLLKAVLGGIFGSLF